MLPRNRCQFLYGTCIFEKKKQLFIISLFWFNDNFYGIIKKNHLLKMITVFQGNTCVLQILICPTMLFFLYLKKGLFKILYFITLISCNYYLCYLKTAKICYSSIISLGFHSNRFPKHQIYDILIHYSVSMFVLKLFW